MKHRLRALLTAAVLAAVQIPSARAAEKTRYQTTFLRLFDTVTTVIGYAESQESFSGQAQRIHDEMEEYDHLYDIYREYPGIVNLCTVNRHAGETVEVDRRIMDLLVLAREVDEVSGHRTDAMFGAVLRIWHEAREKGINDPANAALPDPGELKAAEEHTGFRFLELDEEACTVRLTDPEASLDVGALAKGYAVQRVCEKLPDGYLLSVGGNVAASGPKPDGSAWTVGIQDPDGSGDTWLHRVRVSRGAVVTSGDYQRRYLVNEVYYHHLIDPETLYPGTEWRAVTVIMEDSGMADALSTTLFLSGLEEGQSLLERYGAEAMWLRKDGEQVFSEGYRDYMVP